MTRRSRAGGWCWFRTYWSTTPPGFTHCAAGADFDRWRSLNPPPPPDFTGISVRAAPLDRPEHAARQRFALEHFWPAYFEAASVENLSIDPAA
ncbi:MAG: hypothetical protein NVV62_11590 [Terricaulis sp.]|nr:hypothetical protein [Terricaulis sp.]